ncbi:hypothetical protein ACFLZ5_01395 [Thermodesulfobacteriota bacterium]
MARKKYFNFMLSPDSYHIVLLHDAILSVILFFNDNPHGEDNQATLCFSTLANRRMEKSEFKR